MRKIYLNVMRPIVDRLGTIAATWLMSQGYDTDLTAQAVNAVVAALFLAMDLFLSQRKGEAR